MVLRKLHKAELVCFDAQAREDSDPMPFPVKPVVAALLSPRMAFSLLEWPRMQREAQARGYRVQAWRDPGVPDEEWRQALASNALLHWDVPLPKPLPEACLALWLPVNHWPLVQVLMGDEMHPWPIWGVMPDPAWEASLDVRLQDLLVPKN